MAAVELSRFLIRSAPDPSHSFTRAAFHLYQPRTALLLLVEKSIVDDIWATVVRLCMCHTSPGRWWHWSRSEPLWSIKLTHLERGKVQRLCIQHSTIAPGMAL